MVSIVARGHVNDRPFARSIYWMAAKRFTGDLLMIQDSATYKVTWNQGLVIGADSPAPADAPGRIALNAGLVNSTQLAEMLRLATARSGQSQVQILAELARLTPEQVLEIKRRILIQQAIRIFALDRASFVLDDVPTLQQEPGLTPLSGRWLVYHGLRNHYSEERLAAELAGAVGMALRLTAEARTRVAELGLGAVEKRCVELIGQKGAGVGEHGLTLDEIVAECAEASAKTVMSLVYALLSTDTMEAVAQAGGSRRAWTQPGIVATGQPDAQPGAQPRTWSQPVPMATGQVHPPAPSAPAQRSWSQPLPPAGPQPSSQAGPQAGQAMPASGRPPRPATEPGPAVQPIPRTQPLPMPPRQPQQPAAQPAQRAPTAQPIPRTQPLPMAARQPQPTATTAQPAAAPPGPRTQPTAAQPIPRTQPLPMAPRQPTAPAASQVPAAPAPADARAQQSAAARAPAEGIRELIMRKLAEIDAGADYYRILGVARDASDNDVRAAYFELARKLHPDRLRASGIADIPAEGQRLFAQINLAFGVLGNPKKRAKYMEMISATPSDKVSQDELESYAARVLAAEEHFLRGEMAMRRQGWQDAHNEFLRAVELNPDEADHHAMRGWSLWCVAEDKNAVLAECLSSFRQALERAPQNVNALFYRGRISSLRGEYSIALDYFRKVLAVNPNHQEAALEARLLQSRLDKGGKRR